MPQPARRIVRPLPGLAVPRGVLLGTLVAALGTLPLVGPAWASRSLDVSLSNDTARLELERSLKGSPLGRGLVRGAVFFTDGDEQLLSLGLHVRGEAGSRSPGLFAGLGLDGHLGSLRGKGVAALSLAGALDYFPPPVPRLHLGLRVGYAPKILSFIKADGLLEGTARVGYELLQDAFVYLEYRRLEVGLERAPDRVPDDGGHVGLRFGF